MWAVFQLNVKRCSWSSINPLSCSLKRDQKPNLQLTLIFAPSPDDTISVKYTHNKPTWKANSHVVLHTVYLLVRIIFLITLSEAMGTGRAALPIQSLEPCFWGRLLILWHCANILSFNKTAENLSWGRQKRGRWREFWLAEALCLWSWGRAERSVPSGRVHGATAPWGRRWG